MIATVIQLTSTAVVEPSGAKTESDIQAAHTAKQARGDHDRADAARAPAPRVSIRNLTKVFQGEAGEVVALKGIDLDVKVGEFVSLLGASGCGKTTLLRIVGGLERSYRGDALLDGARIAGPGRDRGFVFQDHRLLPWLTVEENVGFGLSHLKRRDRAGIVRDHLDLVGLRSFAKSYPSQLSGGMAQRASIARALATDPEILLLDEPLGALDAITRMQMQDEIERIWKAKAGLTVLMVTHDVDEALYLSDRIVVLSPRPGTIRRIVDVPLARPRPREGYDFNRLKKVLLEDFELSHKEIPPEFAI